MTVDTVPNYIGYIALTISVIFLGSNYLPVKRYKTGDGMFFQLMMITGIWMVGFIVNWFRNFPRFYPLPMLGGFLWSSGNLNTVPVIKTIGIGLGTLFPNVILLCLGWAIARFGWFGISPEVPSNVYLNYIGVALTVISGFIFVFIKPDTIKNNSDDDTNNYLVNNENSQEVLESEATDMNFFKNINPFLKRMIGIGMACSAGVFYGFTFTPVLYVQDNYGESENALDYVFSLYTGIFVTSITYFSIYCIMKKNKPVINPTIILPAIISGLLWGIGNSAFFLASNALTEAIIFPIVSSGPPIVANLWGVILYREIQGIRNYLLLFLGFGFAIVGSIFCGISK